MIKRDSLLSLEAYARERNAFRARVMEHKKRRTVQLGDHLTLLFEDELTIRYQVQEMLRIERIFEEAGIQGELDAYNPLVPDGTNWKATMLIEYPDVDERKRMLERLKGVERETEEKTSSVHFLRFELAPDMRQALRKGAAISVGVDHPEYRARIELPPEVRASLAADLA